MLSSSFERFYSAKGIGEVMVREGDVTRALEPRSDLSEQRAATFSWGRDETGAAQLAVSLLADALDDDRAAKRYHQDFRNRVIVNLPERWTISRTRILGYVRVIKRQRAYSAALTEDEQRYISGLMAPVSHKPLPSSSAEGQMEPMNDGSGVKPE